jgi:hypothetical protein
MNTSRYFALALMISLIASASWGSETFLITSDAADGSANQDGTTGGQDQGNLVAGVSGDERVSHSAILFFELPQVTSPSDLVAANLALYHTVGGGGNGADDGADVWGLGYISTPPSIEASWYLESEEDLSPGVNIPSRWKIQDDLIAGVEPPLFQWYETDTTGDAELLNFLGELYHNGASGGDFAVLRLNFDSTPTTIPGARYEVASVAWGSGDFAPALTLEVVPEPMTMSLLTLGGVALLKRRK